MPAPITALIVATTVIGPAAFAHTGKIGEILETDSSGQDVSSEQFDKWIKDQVIEYEEPDENDLTLTAQP